MNKHDLERHPENNLLSYVNMSMKLRKKVTFCQNQRCEAFYKMKLSMLSREKLDTFNFGKTSLSSAQKWRERKVHRNVQNSAVDSDWIIKMKLSTLLSNQSTFLWTDRFPPFLSSVNLAQKPACI